MRATWCFFLLFIFFGIDKYSSMNRTGLSLGWCPRMMTV